MGLLSGLGDAIGPILVIVVIYLVYKFFLDIETDQKVKETAAEVSKIEAEIKHEQIKLEREKLFTQYNQQQLPRKDADVEYKVLEDKRDGER